VEAADEMLRRAASLLGCEASALACALCAKHIKAGAEWVEVPNSGQRALELCDGMAKALYVTQSSLLATSSLHRCVASLHRAEMSSQVRSSVLLSTSLIWMPSQVRSPLRLAAAAGQPRAERARRLARYRRGGEPR
jgi:hypothetical protein